MVMPACTPIHAWMNVYMYVLACIKQNIDDQYFLADHYIDGAAFVGLTLPEIREMVPPIGLAKKISNLIPHTWMCV